MLVPGNQRVDIKFLDVRWAYVNTISALKGNNIFKPCGFYFSETLIQGTLTIIDPRLFGRSMSNIPHLQSGLARKKLYDLTVLNKPHMAAYGGQPLSSNRFK